MGNEEEEACELCSRKCLKIHGKNRKRNASSQSIISFFKIMIGDKFSKFLYLPPKFGRTMSDLIGQKLNLEDSNGQKWGITISKLDGLMAFKQGWSAFSLDHGLKFGDFVVFHYVTGSHFVVQIFDKTGFEKVDFPKDNDYPNKRSKIDKNDISKNQPCHASDKSSMNKQSSSTSEVSKSDFEMNQNQKEVNNVQSGKTNPSNSIKVDYMEESYLMINRDLPSKQEDRSSIFDLSNFEMRPHRSNGTRLGNERSSVTPQTVEDIFGKDPMVDEVLNKKMPSNASQFQTGDDFDPISKKISNKDSSNRAAVDPVVVEVPSREKPSNVPQFQTPMKNDNFDPIPNKFSGRGSNNVVATDIEMTASDAKLVEIKKECSDIINKVTKRFQIDQLKKNIPTDTLSRGTKVDVSQKEQTPPSSKVRPIVPKRFAGFSVPSKHKLQNFRDGERMVAVKQELIDRPQGRFSREKMIQGNEWKDIKGNLDFIAKEECKVVKNEPSDTFDFSPQIGPSVSCLVSTNNQSNLELPQCLPPFKGKMIGNGTVLYLRDPVMRLWPVLYHERYNIKVFTSGWEAFSTANIIQKGDECIFELENALEAIFKVRIIRRF